MKFRTFKHAAAPFPRAIAGRVSSQRGLSLIELMVSITIGLLILVALSTLFVNQSKTRSELDKSNRMIDNGRYATELLSETIQLAGYYGELFPTTSTIPVPASLPDPCSTTPAVISASLQLAVQGYEASSQTSVPDVSATTCTSGSAFTLKPGSDILVVRRASTATPIVASVGLTNILYLQVSQCQLDATATTGQPYHIGTLPATNFNLRAKKCAPATIQTWSSATPYFLNDVVNYSGNSYFSLAGSNLNNTPPTNIGTWWSLGSTKYADLLNFLTQVYFVSPDDNTGDGIPTLKRKEYDPGTNQFVTTPLVEGIEYMQIDYGVDNNSDGAPDSYYAVPPTMTDWSNVVAVRIYILARNNETTPGYTDTKTYSLGTGGTFGPMNDSYKRHVFTQFISLNNVAGRRK